MKLFIAVSILFFSQRRLHDAAFLGLGGSYFWWRTFFSVAVVALLPEKVGANLKVRDGPNRALTSKALFKSIAIRLGLINQSAHAFFDARRLCCSIFGHSCYAVELSCVVKCMPTRQQRTREMMHV